MKRTCEICKNELSEKGDSDVWIGANETSHMQEYMCCYCNYTIVYVRDDSKKDEKVRILQRY